LFGFKKPAKALQMSSEPVIRVSNLSKSFPIYASPVDRLKQFILPRIRRLFGLQSKQYYKSFTALSDISFEVHRGETIGIVGKNGAGKSTLLQILCDTLSQTTGSLEVTGRVAALLELGSGFNMEFTGRENIYFQAQILGLSNQEVDSRFEAISDFADIGVFIDQPVRTYSSGMYVRLAFAVIVHVDADILIIDEALAVGDAFFNQKCMRFLQEFRKHGTLIFVTHDPAALKALCERCLWLDKGHLIADDETKLISEGYLANRYDDEDNKNLILMNPGENSVASFGTRKIVIEKVSLQNLSNPNSQVFGRNENVEIKFAMKSYETVDRVICGFNLKNHLGQVIFGENTLAQSSRTSYSTVCDSSFSCSFIFRMPKLGTGIYSIDVAVAEGDAVWHQQLHWIYDAVFIEFVYEKIAPNILNVDIDEIRISPILIK
jgi:lipopolysaccharide transport system ATP-binding protein